MYRVIFYCINNIIQQQISGAKCERKIDFYARNEFFFLKISSMLKDDKYFIYMWQRANHLSFSGIFQSTESEG
jgi:hypothetical protein